MRKTYYEENKDRLKVIRLMGIDPIKAKAVDPEKDLKAVREQRVLDFVFKKC